MIKLLIIKCAACKSKIFRYRKIGKGQVLRCYKSRINRFFKAEITDEQLKCGKCGSILGKLIDNKIKMEKGAFTYSGTKE